MFDRGLGLIKSSILDYKLENRVKMTIGLHQEHLFSNATKMGSNQNKQLNGKLVVIESWLYTVSNRQNYYLLIVHVYIYSPGLRWRGRTEMQLNLSMKEHFNFHFLEYDTGCSISTSRYFTCRKKNQERKKDNSLNHIKIQYLLEKGEKKLKSCTSLEMHVY